MKNLKTDSVQFSRVEAEVFINFPDFQRSLKMFGILFGNSYIHFAIIIRLFNFTCAEGKLR